MNAVLREPGDIQRAAGRECAGRNAPPAGASGRLLSVSAEARVFWQLRLRIARSLICSALRRARLQVLTVTLAMLVLWIGLFVLFHEGFALVQSGVVHAGMRAQMTHAIFNVFFLALTVMLIFSSAIILYGGLFRSPEVSHLLTTPAREERIVWHKFQETAFFSGWGFVLLASPTLLAYGIVVHAPGYYYLLLAPFVVSFVMVATGVGALACLAVVRLVPAIRVHALVAAVALFLAAGGYFAWRVLASQHRNAMTPSWFQDVVARLEFSEQRLFPSWWLSSGLLEAAHPVSAADRRPEGVESLLFLSVLCSNALLLHVLLGKMAARVLRPSHSNLQGLGRARRRGTAGWLDRGVLWLCAPMPRVARHMLVKDLRLFRRDPVQWSQFAIFLGLLTLYFLNSRRFDYQGVMERWVLLISFFNLAVVGLLLSAFTTRFVFPMISLEGRRLWILGTAPIPREIILWGKFWFACAGAVPTCASLVLISDLMLGVAAHSPSVVLIHQASCLALCVGLSAMAVGFGARLPNLRETSPAKIAAGFGGTLNLVLSSLYIVAVIVLNAVPCFFWQGRPDAAATRGGFLFSGRFGLGTPGSVVAGILLTALLAAAATVLPLRIGLRALRELEA